MTKEEIMMLYHGWDKATISAISKYVDKFNKPWPVYGPKDVKFIYYCVDHDKSIDDLDENDPMFKKYIPKNIIY